MNDLSLYLGDEKNYPNWLGGIIITEHNPNLENTNIFNFEGDKDGNYG